MQRLLALLSHPASLLLLTRHQDGLQITASLLGLCANVLRQLSNLKKLKGPDFNFELYIIHIWDGMGSFDGKSSSIRQGLGKALIYMFVETISIDIKFLQFYEFNNILT